MTIAEFFIIRPHGPNCWIGLGAFRLLVLLRIKMKPIRLACSCCRQIIEKLFASLLNAIETYLNVRALGKSLRFFIAIFLRLLLAFLRGSDGGRSATIAVTAERKKKILAHASNSKRIR